MPDFNCGSQTSRIQKSTKSQPKDAIREGSKKFLVADQVVVVAVVIHETKVMKFRL